MLFLILAILATWVALAAFNRITHLAGLRAWIGGLMDGQAAIVKGFFFSTALSL